MTEKKAGVIGQLLKNNMSVCYCSIHQQSLLAKENNRISAMLLAVRVILKIRGGHNFNTPKSIILAVAKVLKDFELLNKLSIFLYINTFES